MATTRRKQYFDHQVAAELGIPVRQVRHITTAFLAKVIDALLERDLVVIEAFGRFLLKESAASNTRTRVLTGKPVKGKTSPKLKDEIYKVTRTFRVHFKKSETLGRLLRLKYGPSGQREKKS